MTIESSGLRAEDIAFIINPSLWYKSMYPTGILYLSSYLTLKGFPNIILDSKVYPKKVPFHRRMEFVLSRLKAIKPKIICLSSTHKEFDEVIKINNAIRGFNDNIFTIVGGSQPTYRISDYLNNGFDFVCVGEGEKTLYEFVKEVFERTFRWKQINGLAWRNGSKIIINKKRALINGEELQTDLFCAYEQIDKRYFDINVEVIRGLPLVGALLLTTRGCPYSCSFCGCSLIFGHRLRFRSLESIEREINYLKTKYGVEGVWIVDDTFTVNKNHALGVAKLLNKNDIIWGCQSRVDTIDEPIIKKFKEYGCIQIDFGVESGSQRILDEIIKKKINTDQIIRAFALTKKYKIRSLANFMIGLPSETYKDLNATKNIARRINADVYVFSIATPLPGTKLYELVSEDIDPHQYSLLDWNGSRLTEKLNKSEITNIVKERRHLKNKYLIRSMIRSIFSINGIRFVLFRKHRLTRIMGIFKYIYEIIFGKY
jgi:radical SAM superfamily enzyme YgiQ (UPF0313 family)